MEGCLHSPSGPACEQAKETAPTTAGAPDYGLLGNAINRLSSNGPSNESPASISKAAEDAVSRSCVWSKVEKERLHLRDDQVLYRKELKDWTSFLAHASRWSRSVCIRLFWMRYALTSNVVMMLIVSLVLWPAIAKIVLAIG
eukprot:g19852.t1